MGGRFHNYAGIKQHQESYNTGEANRLSEKKKKTVRSCIELAKEVGADYVFGGQYYCHAGLKKKKKKGKLNNVNKSLRKGLRDYSLWCGFAVISSFWRSTIGFCTFSSMAFYVALLLRSPSCYVMVKLTNTR